MKMRILSTLSRRKILTAPTAPLSLASVKMSTSCDACVALASHETSATQDVVAAFGNVRTKLQRQQSGPRARQAEV
jgi:hypothetical protein